MLFGTATVTVYNDCDDPVVGATVVGAFTGDWQDAVEGLTDENGVVQFQTGTALKKPVFSFEVYAVLPPPP